MFFSKRMKPLKIFLPLKGKLEMSFSKIGEEVKTALKILFQPDKMNYAALSNTSPAIHVHIVPRYKDAREFSGKIFKDTRWGQNYAPYDRSFILEESVLLEIRDALKKHLN